jgi:hypothetical protein
MIMSTISLPMFTRMKHVGVQEGMVGGRPTFWHNADYMNHPFFLFTNVVPVLVLVADAHCDGITRMGQALMHLTNSRDQCLGLVPAYQCVAAG